jgi:spore coat polysaccharide biosynthesis protein SpsF (cytidylyltransferase family)
MKKTVLEYVVERVKKAKRIERVIVATTIRKEDLGVADLAGSLGAGVYRGADEDVLDRFYQAAKLFGIKHIVRITADCPLIDPQIIDKVIDLYFRSNADYCSNTLKETFPDGEDVEVFSFNVLRSAWKNARLLSEREHVTPYIKKNTDKYKPANLENDKNLSYKRWTVDTKEDFGFIKAVLETLYPKKPDFGMQDILELLEHNPHIEEMNKGIMRNEGYAKSLREDKAVNIDYTKEQDG